MPKVCASWGGYLGAVMFCLYSPHWASVVNSLAVLACMRSTHENKSVVPWFWYDHVLQAQIWAPFPTDGLEWTGKGWIELMTMGMDGWGPNNISAGRLSSFQDILWCTPMAFISCGNGYNFEFWFVPRWVTFLVYQDNINGGKVSEI